MIDLPNNIPEHARTLCEAPGIIKIAQQHAHFDGHDIDALALSLTDGVHSLIPTYDDEDVTALTAIHDEEGHCQHRSALLYAAGIQIPNIVNGILSFDNHSYNVLASTVTKQGIIIDNDIEPNGRNTGIFELLPVDIDSDTESDFLYEVVVRTLLKSDGSDLKQRFRYKKDAYLNKRVIMPVTREDKIIKPVTLRFGKPALRFLERVNNPKTQAPAFEMWN